MRATGPVVSDGGRGPSTLSVGDRAARLFLPAALLAARRAKRWSSVQAARRRLRHLREVTSNALPRALPLLI